MRRSPIAILFVTVFIDLLGFGIVVPFLAYTVETFGGRAGAVGILMSAFSLAQFVFAPIWGRVSDRVGRRPILLLGLAGSALGFTVFGLAGSLAMLFAGRLLAGVAGATIPTAQAYIADVTTPEDRAKGMGMIGAAFGLGFILGPALGGVLTEASGPLATWLSGGALAPLGHILHANPYALPSLFAAAISALNLVAATFWLPESLQPALREAARARGRMGRFETLRQGFADDRLRTLVTAFFLFVIGFAMMETTFTLLIERRLYGVEWSGLHALLVRRVGYLFAYIGVISATVQGGLMGRLSRRFGEVTLLTAGLSLGALALGALPLCTNWPAIIVCAGFLALGTALVNPCVSSLISRAAPKDSQGGTLGISQAAGSLARVLGPVTAGALFQGIGAGAPYALAAALAAIAALLALRLRRVAPELAAPAGAR